MTVDTSNLRRWSNAVAGWHESGMTLTTMDVAGKLAPLAREAAAEIEQLRTALAAVPHSTFCAFMTAAHNEPCSCPKSLNTDPVEVEVEGSIFPIGDLPDILGRHMRALADAARREKQHWIEQHEQPYPHSPTGEQIEVALLGATSTESVVGFVRVDNARDAVLALIQNGADR